MLPFPTDFDDSDLAGTRERLMWAFNSPIFPEVLVSSRILSEGVDLHRFCRYVIHHDMDWNPTTGRMTDISLRALSDLSQAEIVDKVEHEFPKRMRSILMRKLGRRYHERPNCEGLPLVLVVAPFFEAGSTTYVDLALLNLFYGRNDAADGSDGLFYDPAGAQISAVLFTNAFTVSRFIRLATPWESADFVAEREGLCYQPDDPGSTYGFRYRMGAPETPRETWAEGVTLFFNPNATNPLGEGALPCTCLYARDDTGVYRTISGFHPLSSGTFMNPRAEASAPTASQA